MVTPTRSEGRLYSGISINFKDRLQMPHVLGVLEEKHEVIECQKVFIPLSLWMGEGRSRWINSDA